MPCVCALRSRVCSNNHAIVRKYGLNICRQCFREKAADIGFVKVRWGWWHGCTSRPPPLSRLVYTPHWRKADALCVCVSLFLPSRSPSKLLACSERLERTQRASM